jgi:ubiquinone/menaquinone biosynthesis C-methylase UbiE
MNNHLRATFDTAALLYDEARPGYPETLFDDIVMLSGIPAGGRILEIGPGTGKATLPMARRGYAITGIEIGENLAAVARQKLAAYPRVEIVTGTFEELEIGAESYDLVMSATAFHWIEQPIGFQKCARVLRPGGAIAIFRHHHIQDSANSAVWPAIQEVYLREDPNAPPEVEWLTADEVPDESGEIESTGLFGPVNVRRYFWDEWYDAESYIRLLKTFSGHIALHEPNRQRLFDGIAELINKEPGGRIAKGHLALLHVASKRS